MRTVPVKYSAGPFRDGCDPLRLISIISLLDLVACGEGCARSDVATLIAAIAPTVVSNRLRLGLQSFSISLSFVTTPSPFHLEDASPGTSRHNQHALMNVGDKWHGPSSTTCKPS
jgi:hypothetical protein